MGKIFIFRTIRTNPDDVIFNEDFSNPILCDNVEFHYIGCILSSIYSLPCLYDIYNKYTTNNFDKFFK